MNEREKHIKNQREFLIEEQKQELAKNSELIQGFIEHCNSIGINITEENIEYTPKIGIIAKYPNLVFFLNPKIQIDKEELVSFNILDAEFKRQQVIPGYLFAENYMIMANSYFRRGHYEENAFAPRFIDVFWKYNLNNIDKYISLDFDRVRINVDNSMFFEFDTWYGAKFNKNITKIADDIVKLAPPLDLEPFNIEFLFGNVHSLNIKWYTKGKIKVFQAEEFKQENSRIIKNDIEYYPAKYLHAEFDISTGNFRHFDGAIHFYTESEYYQRRDTDFNHNEKNDSQIKTLSQKLFKVNGEIGIKDWVELTSHYLTGNPLIFEYFEGKLPDRINEIVDAIRKGK